MRAPLRVSSSGKTPTIVPMRKCILAKRVGKYEKAAIIVLRLRRFWDPLDGFKVRDL